MQQDDRFITIAGVCALLVTVSAFLWVHRQAILRAGTDLRAAAAAETANPVDSTGGTASASVPTTPAPRTVHISQPSLVAETHAVVPASLELDSIPLADGWPANRDSARRLFDAVLAVSGGATPAVPGDPLPAPDEVLVCRDRDGRLVVAPGTHRRYDAIVEAFDAFDTEALVASLDDLGELWALESPDSPEFTSALATAIDHLLEAEPPNVDPDMVSRGTHWGFADSDDERLSAAQKHMLLMGRRNARVVRARLAEIRNLVGDIPADSAGDPIPRFDEETLVAEDPQPSETRIISAPE